MVQVIACTQASALHRKLRDHDYAAETAANTGYRSLTRGMFVQGVAESLAAPADPAATAPRWAETHIMVSSYPKLKQ